MGETKSSDVIPHRQMDRLLVIVLMVGAGMRLWQYLGNASLWLDEILLARNIVDRSVWDLLTRPLANDQVAPKGFLFAEKLASTAVNSSDYALRIFPLLCSLIALVAFWRISRRVLFGVAPLVALALYAVSMPLVMVSAEVKQYSADVAVAALLLWLALELEGQPISIGRSLWIGCAGAICVWFSQPAALVVIGLGASLALFDWFGLGALIGDRVFGVGAPLVLWGVSALAAAIDAIATIRPATLEFLQVYWADGFPPSFGGVTAILRWPWHELKALFGTGEPAGFAYPYPVLFVALFVIGGWALWRRRVGPAALILAPVVVTLAAALIHQYPFKDRLLLFLVPNFLLAIGAGIEWCRQRLSSIYIPLGWLASALFVTLALAPTVQTHPIYEVEDMKPVLSYVQARRHRTDLVYASYGASYAMSFYGARYGFGNDGYSVGACHHDARRYFAELDSFRGEPRVWILLTHTLSTYHERENVLGYLDAIGVQREAYIVPAHTVVAGSSAAEAFLYDLSNTARLTQATARSFPILEPVAAEAKFGCSK